MANTIDDKTKRLAETAFIRARIYLLQHRPFYAHLAMKLQLRWLEDTPGGLSATDGESLFVNPVAFLALSKGQQVTMLVHEVLHCACGHLWRRGAREPMKFNVAADVTIDNIIHADGFESGPWEASREQWLRAHGLTFTQFNGVPAESIYDKLPDLPKNMGSCGCGGNGEGGCFRDKSGASQGERSEAEAKWRDAVLTAGQLAGKQPGAWQELVKAAMPRPPFHLKLFEYLNRGMGGDTDWGVLNRRYMWRGLYLPTETRTVMGRVAWVTDTSGSMCSAQLKLAFGYFRGFRDQHPCQADLICCDYGVASHKTYEEFETLPSEFTAAGRGGTSFNAPFQMLREKRIEPRVLIYATDGFGSCDVPRPAYPVLWLVIGGDQAFKPPFGEVVHVPQA
jgi:predicted metal-dependent peptidase